MCLSLVDPQLPVLVHVDCDEEVLSVVLTQTGKEGLRLIGIGGRKLLVRESRAPRLEQLLTAATWGIKRWGRYTYYAPSLLVVLPTAAEVAAVKTTSPAPSLMTLLLGLECVRAQYCVGDGAWTI